MSNPKRQRKLIAGALVLIPGFLLMLSMVALPLPSTMEDVEIAYTEILPVDYDESVLKPLEKMAETKDYGQCTVRNAIFPAHPIEPCFSASYPGSGAKMTWLLIEAITGLQTHNDITFEGKQHAVTTKTHYPSKEGHLLDGHETVPRAIVVLRQPLNALPSYFNYLYEMENQLENHSTRAPIEAWIKWRDTYLQQELEAWRNFVDYWMQKYTPVNRLLASFEKLTDDVMGPAETTRVAEFLSRSEGVHTCPPELIPCVWHKVVKYKDSNSSGNEGRRLQVVDASDAERGPGLANFQIDPTKFALSDPTQPNSQRSGPEYIPPYTQEQFDSVKVILNGLIEKYSHEKSLVPILESYIDGVDKRKEELKMEGN
uniref:Sulfotransferase domain-containing protein n=1 Tax=Ditylum brightwellii TaxID=49249 RepID=A0A7S4V3C2_9STRA|mmetsp:Transcript_29367/g.42612  ORF Transcript_29367/g.42612 Transcript_29367/m.42612 type:complete len:371 (-) Transcript_29367:287-1399(-)